MKTKFFFSKYSMMYSPINHKAKQIQEYVEDFINTLFDQASLDKFIDDVRKQSAKLDMEERRSLPMVVSCTFSYDNHEKSIRLEITQKSHPDKCVLIMDFVEVRKVIRFELELNFEDHGKN